jgi:prolyl-tRNA synthetase
MHLQHLFARTTREAPAEAEIASHRLLLRGGYIYPIASGIYAYLPLARRALNRVEQIIREEMDAIGGQELTMPVLQPAELWQASGRYQAIGAELMRLQDRAGRDMVLAMTHEEVVAELTRHTVLSYRQLPQLVYQIYTKERDEPRARGGLIRVREFTMKDSYSLDVDEAGLDVQYRAHYQAYFNVFHRCGLPVVAVASDVGMMGGSGAHEYMFVTPIGEDTLVLCDACGYAANRQVAAATRPVVDHGAPEPLAEVATPETPTIAALAELLGIPAHQTGKAVFFVATTGAAAESPKGGERFVAVIVRGDTEVNETKLTNALHANALRPATDAEIEAHGMAPGYASPIGVDPARVLVIVDRLVSASANLVVGANRPGFHLRNSNYGRDYTAALVADVVAAADGDPCPQCGAPVHTARGVEVGNIFKLGAKYSAALGATFLDRDSAARPVIMGSYGIGVGRLLACVVEHCHDAQGIVWPASLAPYDVHLVSLNENAAADEVYRALQAAGLNVLYDDREESAGVKFADADLLGMPIRVTVSKRTLKDGAVEVKLRRAEEKMLVPRGDAVAHVQALRQQLLDEIATTVRPVAGP